MKLDLVAPELRGRLRMAGGLRVEGRLARSITSAALALMPAAKVSGVSMEKRRDGGRGVRIHRPVEERPGAALLFFHGGGFVVGRASISDRLCAEIARDARVAVISAEYRKAPGHPFPAPLDDAHHAWTWLQREPSLGIDPSRIVVGGESAGGGLAASLAQRLHDQGGVQPAGQLLFCPVLDDRTAARRDLDAIDHFVWNNRKNRFGWRSYLGTEPGASSVPTVAVPARRADLAGLPPAWIGWGAIELFRDEDAAYAERLAAAGVAVTTDVVPGAPHGFETWAPDSPQARGHIAGATAWLRRLIGG